MSVWVTLQMKVNKGAFESLQPFLEENLPNVRGFKGALNVSIFYDADTRNFMILEEWLSREHHQSYIKFITDNGVMERLLNFMQGSPTVTYYDRLVL